MPQIDNQKADVVIIGGGLVGLTLACALGDSNLEVVVVEPQPRAPEAYWQRVVAASERDFDPRVSALTLASEQILCNLGAWSHMQQVRVSPYSAMHVWDGEGTAKIDFSAAALYQPHLGHIVENRVTLAALYRVAAGFDNVHLLTGVGLRSLEPPVYDADAVAWRSLRLSDEQELQARLVVAADGARSQTRRLAGLPIHEWDYQHHAIVATVRTEQHHQFTAWQRFTEDGPLAFLPLAGRGDDGSLCSIVWSTSPDHARELMAQGDEEFCRSLSQGFESRLGRVLECEPRHCFPLVQRHAPQYVTQGVALVGDAAHSIHPLAGQGVNLGLLDAATLAEVLLAGVEAGADFSSRRWLRRYQRRRQAENLRMMAAMAGFKHLFAQVPAPIHWLRNRGMHWVDGLDPLKNLLAERAMGLEQGRPQLARPQA